MFKRVIKNSVLLATLAIAGCGSILGPVEQRRTIDYEITDPSFLSAPELSKIDSGGCTTSSRNDIIYVSTMHANAPYNSTKMFYSNAKYELEKYSYSQWAALPTDMLSQTMVKKIVLSCDFKNVVTNNAIANANYSLVTQLVVLRQDVNPDGKTSVVMMIIYAQLIDLDKNIVKSSRVFALHENGDAGPVGFTNSINSMMTNYDNQLVTWLRTVK
jgi:ABC-type uncharacterized transport system auxiliary subunit